MSRCKGTGEDSSGGIGLEGGGGVGGWGGGERSLFSSPGSKGHIELLPYQCIWHGSCVVCQQLKTNCSDFFFYKTTGPTVSSQISHGA